MVWGAARRTGRTREDVVRRAVWAVRSLASCGAGWRARATPTLPDPGMGSCNRVRATGSVRRRGATAAYGGGCFCFQACRVRCFCLAPTRRIPNDGLSVGFSQTASLYGQGGWVFPWMPGQQSIRETRWQRGTGRRHWHAHGGSADGSSADGGGASEPGQKLGRDFIQEG